MVKMDEMLKLYRSCFGAGKIFPFLWNISEDCFFYDASLLGQLPYPLPQEGAMHFLKEAAFLQEDDRGHFRKHIDFLAAFPFHRARRTRPYSILLRIQSPQQVLIYYRFVYQLSIDDNGTRSLYGILQDISLFYKENAALKQSLQHDAMTGLYAKTYAPKLVNQLLKTWGTRGRHHALLVLDLDHFKEVNDKLGHLIGDAVILDLALALKTNFRKQDVLGHIGGDEFVVFMPNAEKEGVLRRCEALRRSMRRNLGKDESKLYLTGSIGISFAPEHGTDYKTLFAHADSALYEAKRRGRDNQVIYDENLEARQHKVAANDASSLAYQELIDHPMDYIFRTVLHAKDTALSVRLLLEIFAKHFHVQRAYVFWNIDGSYWPRLLYEYCADENDSGFRSHDPEVRRLMWRRYKENTYGRFTECADTTRLPERMHEIFDRANIHAWMECAMMEGTAFLGGVGFDVTEGRHGWTRAEHEVLAAFANIMHRFLLGQIFFERTRGTGTIYF